MTVNRIRLLPHASVNAITTDVADRPYDTVATTVV